MSIHDHRTSTGPTASDDPAGAWAIASLPTRRADLRELVTVLEDQHARKLDVVAAASSLRAEGGRLVVAGAGQKVITLDGVSDTDVTLRPTSSADGDIADKLEIPVKYLRRLRAQGKTD